MSAPVPQGEFRCWRCHQCRVTIAGATDPAVVPTCPACGKSGNNLSALYDVDESGNPAVERAWFDFALTFGRQAAPAEERAA